MWVGRGPSILSIIARCSLLSWVCVEKAMKALSTFFSSETLGNNTQTANKILPEHCHSIFKHCHLQLLKTDYAMQIILHFPQLRWPLNNSSQTKYCTNVFFTLNSSSTMTVFFTQNARKDHLRYSEGDIQDVTSSCMDAGFPISSIWSLKVRGVHVIKRLKLAVCKKHILFKLMYIPETL